MDGENHISFSVWFYSFMDQMPSVHAGSFAHELFNAEAFASHCAVCKIMQTGNCYSFYVTLYMNIGRGGYAKGEFCNMVVKQLLFFRHLDCSGESSEVIQHGLSVGP